MSKLNEYLEATTPGEKPATDLLGLQDLIAKMVNSKGVDETLYAIAIGLQNSKESNKLQKIIKEIRDFNIRDDRQSQMAMKEELKKKYPD